MKKGYVQFFCGLLLTAMLFLFTKEFFSGAVDGLKNCAAIIIPSLFPFMVSSTLCASGEMPQKLLKALSPVCRILFDQRAESMGAIILGLFGGYPTGAKAAVSLYKSGKITKKQAQRLILFCVNAGAGFCVTALGGSMLGSRKAGCIILVSLCISAIVLGLFARGKREEFIPRAQIIPQPFSQAFVSSVSSAGKGIIDICAFVTLFSGLISCISASGINEKYLLPLYCIAEITCGCANAAGKIPLEFIAAACAFGGICVHMQVFAIAGEAAPPIGKFYLFRVLHAGLSALVCSVLLRFFPIEIHTAVTLNENAALISLSVPVSLSMLIMCALLILDLDCNKKIC